MNDRRLIVIKTPEQGHIAFVSAWKMCKKLLRDGKTMVLEVRPERRQERHSSHFHSLINQISKQVGGDFENADDAKRILLSAFRFDTITDANFVDEWVRFGDVRMGRGLRGEVVMLGNQSKEFSNKMAKGFIEWLYSFGAAHGVTFKPWGDEK